MNEKLKPCPFCGHSAHVERYGDRGKSTIYQCDFCGCRLETGEEWGHGKQWNERAALTPDPAVNGGAVKEAEELGEINDALQTINSTCLMLQYDNTGRYGVETIEPLRNVAKLINKLVFQSALTSPQGEETPAAPSPQADLVGVELPTDIIESLLAVGPVEWGVSLTQPDEKHASDLLDTLRITREHFGVTDEETGIHGVYLEGTGTVLAHTGMSPNSPQHARILVGAWNQLVEIATSQKANRKVTRHG